MQDRHGGLSVRGHGGVVALIRARDGGVTPQRAGRKNHQRVPDYIKLLSVSEALPERSRRESNKAREEFKPRARPWEGKE